ncbi:GL16667 [Drosophila persimilis]|uniref:GL16667 n=1 Tax=Drosophila persimilis TaxID=7234 RepID=B4IS25_DROPE|nr:GL16667 [Drosophila persimilis]
MPFADDVPSTSPAARATQAETTPKKPRKPMTITIAGEKAITITTIGDSLSHPIPEEDYEFRTAPSGDLSEDRNFRVRGKKSCIIYTQGYHQPGI